MSRAGVVASALVLTASLAACGGTEGEADPTGSGPDAEESTSVDAALLECGEPDPDAVQLTGSDLAAATWRAPAGYTETFDYSEDRPVEHVETVWVAEPEQSPAPLDVLTVVVYSGLDWGEEIDECGRVPAAVVDERLAGYREEIGATPLTDPVATEVAGLPALQQDLALPEYDYRGTWLFGRTQLVHVYCQWSTASSEEPIVTACAELVGSLEVPGA